MNEHKDYIYIVDSNIEALSTQVAKLQRKTRGIKLGFVVAVIGGIWITDVVAKVTVLHIKEIKKLREEIAALKGDKV